MDYHRSSCIVNQTSCLILSVCVPVVLLHGSCRGLPSDLCPMIFGFTGSGNVAKGKLSNA